MSDIQLVNGQIIERLSISFDMPQGPEPVNATIELSTWPKLSLAASLTREALIDSNLRGYSALALRGSDEELTQALFQIHLTMDPAGLTASGFGQVIGLSDQISMQCINARGEFSKDDVYQILMSYNWKLSSLARLLRSNGTL